MVLLLFRKIFSIRNTSYNQCILFRYIKNKISKKQRRCKAFLIIKSTPYYEKDKKQRNKLKTLIDIKGKKRRDNNLEKKWKQKI